MLNKIFLSVLVLCSFVFSGCALTVDKIPLNYSTPSNIVTDGYPSYRNISIQDFQDDRSIPNSKWILQKRNEYGALCSGAFESEKEIAGIIHDAVADVLASNRYKIVVSDADYLIKGKLLSIDDDYVMGFWAGNLKLKMEVELSLVDTIKQETIWKEVIVAHGISEKTTSTKIAIQTAFKSVLNDLLKKFVVSDFIHKLK